MLWCLSPLTLQGVSMLPPPSRLGRVLYREGGAAEFSVFSDVYDITNIEKPDGNEGSHGSEPTTKCSPKN